MSRASLTALARVYLADADRRDLLRGIGAALASAGFTLVDLAGDKASGKNKKKKRKRRRRKRCRNNEKKCGKTCVKGVCCPTEPCGSGDCFCTVAIEGDAFCAANKIVLCVDCTATSECDPGERCREIGGDGSGCCFPECGTV